MLGMAEFFPSNTPSVLVVLDYFAVQFSRVHSRTRGGDLQLPLSPVRLAVPLQCPKCGEAHTIYPMPLMRETVVDLRWFCRNCHHEWPVVQRDMTAAEQTIAK